MQRIRALYEQESDVLAIVVPNDGGKRLPFVERSYGPGVTRLLLEDTRELIGWTFYNFSGLFPNEKLYDPDELLPNTGMTYELVEVPGREFALKELLQWVYDNVIHKKAAA